MLGTQLVAPTSKGLSVNASLAWAGFEKLSYRVII